MQKSQFTDEQIVAILQQAEKGDKPVSEVCRLNNTAEVCRQHNVSENSLNNTAENSLNNIAENSFYRWRSRFGGMSVHERQ